MLRPTLPRRFEQVPAMPGLNGSGVFVMSCATKPMGMHWAAKETGAVGSAKHLVLMSLLGFLDLRDVPQPGPDTRFGKSNGSLLFSPNGSPPLPNVGVSGKPSCTFRIPPICQPFVRCANNGFSDLLPGICQLPLITKTRPIL